MQTNYYVPQPVIPMGFAQPQQGFPQQQYAQPQDTNPSCRQLAQQPFQFGQHMPAPTPSVPQLPPQIQQILPLMAIEVGNFLGQSAAANPVYTYYYNVVSQNSFRNTFWERLVTFSGYYLWLAIQQRMYANDQEAVRQSAQASVQMLAAVTAMETPQLQAFVDASLWANCVTIAQRMQMVQQQFSSLTQQPQVQQAVQQGFNQTNFGQAAYTPQPVQPLQWQNTAIAAPAPQTAVTDPMGMGSTTYRSRGGSAAVAPSPAPKYMAIPGEPAQTVETVVRAPVVESNNQVRGIIMTPNQGVTNVLESNTPVTGAWSPFYGQYFIPAYDNNHQKLTMVSRAVAGLVGNRNIYIVENKGEQMNQADHVIGTAKAMYRETNHSDLSRLHQVGNDLELAAKALSVSANKEDEETTATYKAMKIVAMDAILPTEDSVVGLINEARIMRFELQHDVQTAFTVEGSIACKFITRESYRALFETLKTLETFGDVVTLLKKHVQDHKTGETASLMGRIDRYLTRELLHVIRRRMGLASFSFDSFIDDIGDVFAVIKKDWGDLYFNALTKYQKTFISGLFGGDAMAFMEQTSDRYVDCVASAPRVSVTMMDVDSLEFGVKIPDEAAYEVFSTNFPGLYEFIEAVVTSQPLATHHYMVTDDDVVYEVHQALIGDKTYLISNGISIT